MNDSLVFLPDLTPAPDLELESGIVSRSEPRPTSASTSASASTSETQSGPGMITSPLCPLPPPRSSSTSSPTRTPAHALAFDSTGETPSMGASLSDGSGTVRDQSRSEDRGKDAHGVREGNDGGDWDNGDDQLIDSRLDDDFFPVNVGDSLQSLSHSRSHSHLRVRSGGNEGREGLGQGQGQGQGRRGAEGEGVNGDGVRDGARDGSGRDGHDGDGGDVGGKLNESVDGHGSESEMESESESEDGMDEWDEARRMG